MYIVIWYDSDGAPSNAVVDKDSLYELVYILSRVGVEFDVKNIFGLNVTPNCFHWNYIPGWRIT